MTRKELDGSELTVDIAEQIPQGDMGHVVWQTAYAAAYAKIFVASANADEEVAKSQWHSHIALALEAADLTYYSYIGMGGNEAKSYGGATKKKRPEGPPFEYGEFEVAKETEKALKVKKPGQDDQDGVWVPKSQIHSESAVKTENDSGMLLVSQWYATQNNLGENATKEDEIPF
jgi:hypothetical protein